MRCKGFLLFTGRFRPNDMRFYDKVRLLLKVSKLIGLFLEKLPIHKIYGRKECMGLHARAHDYFTS